MPISEEQAELNLLVHGLGFSMDEFLTLACWEFEEMDLFEGQKRVLIKLAEALLAIANLQIQIDKHKEDVDAINLRLDLMNVPRDCTEDIGKIIV